MSKKGKILERFYLENTVEAGVDEAGRGPLFGRLYIGSAILPQDDSFNHSLMRDSKKLSERKRLIAYDYIREYAIDYATYSVESSDIDTDNIYVSTLNGMHRVLDKLLVKPAHILVDGSSFIPYSLDGKSIPHICITGGDDKYTAIAAASILAKVERDNYIKDLCKEQPQLDEYYSLLSNKGYGTKLHIDGIKAHGITFNVETYM
jgi:ribonuclease HII